MSIELPKDAERREIPLDTTVLYDKDGKEVEVSRWQYYPGLGYWNLKSAMNKFYYGGEVHLTPPDSWEKLEEDFDKCIDADDSCRYYSTSGICAKCTRPDNDGCGCTAVMFSDIKKRIRKLRGED